MSLSQRCFEQLAPDVLLGSDILLTLVIDPIYLLCKVMIAEKVTYSRLNVNVIKLEKKGRIMEGL